MNSVNFRRFPISSKNWKSSLNVFIDDGMYSSNFSRTSTMNVDTKTDSVFRPTKKYKLGAILDVSSIKW